ncbi:unnamed protein product [Ostreobium quekettii]|uniref:Uncharacterized protein n=1 Tax=Ostreobium quekettii TaxID=121088 RepID=A0A8S1JDV8_9CHLO|nr:unnamed protein product [Ostreobium quekettii]
MRIRFHARQKSRRHSVDQPRSATPLSCCVQGSLQFWSRMSSASAERSQKHRSRLMVCNEQLRFCKRGHATLAARSDNQRVESQGLLLQGHQKLRTEHIRETCEAYQDWASHWEEVQRQGVARVKTFNDLVQAEAVALSGHRAKSVHWGYQVSRELMTGLEIPLDSAGQVIIVRTWWSRWSTLD